MGRTYAPVSRFPLRAKQITSSLFVFVLFFVGLFPATPSSARQANPPHPLPASGSGVPRADAEEQDRVARDMAKKANLERQLALKGDTDKLVKLAGELKQYVDQSNENILSMNVVKKAEEIEKLAHTVKEKMKGPN
jgi:hypothetical protein